MSSIDHGFDDDIFHLISIDFQFFKIFHDKNQSGSAKTQEKNKDNVFLDSNIRINQDDRFDWSRTVTSNEEEIFFVHSEYLKICVFFIRLFCILSLFRRVRLLGRFLKIKLVSIRDKLRTINSQIIFIGRFLSYVALPFVYLLVYEVLFLRYSINDEFQYEKRIIRAMSVF